MKTSRQIFDDVIKKRNARKAKLRTTVLGLSTLCVMFALCVGLVPLINHFAPDMTEVTTKAPINAPSGEQMPANDAEESYAMQEDPAAGDESADMPALVGGLSFEGIISRGSEIYIGKYLDCEYCTFVNDKKETQVYFLYSFEVTEALFTSCAVKPGIIYVYETLTGEGCFAFDEGNEYLLSLFLDDAPWSSYPVYRFVCQYGCDVTKNTACIDNSKNTVSLDGTGFDNYVDYAKSFFDGKKHIITYLSFDSVESAVKGSDLVAQVRVNELVFVRSSPVQETEAYICTVTDTGENIEVIFIKDQVKPGDDVILALRIATVLPNGMISYKFTSTPQNSVFSLDRKAEIFAIYDSVKTDETTQDD